MSESVTRRRFFQAIPAAGALMWPAFNGRLSAAAASGKPNIILFVGDDLGCNELGSYGQEKIRTPHIDQLAREGMRFTQTYSGSPVCAPSRCVLLTGLHTGHAFIRDNREVEPEGQLPIPAGTLTLPEMLKQEGYATAVIGKWGLGFPGSEGEPNKQGFDHFFGYNCQRHAHNHYPTYLWRNNQRLQLEGNTAGLTGKHYAPDLMESEALDFIKANKDRPFFLFYATTIPHLALQVPEDSLQEYLGKWDDPPYKGETGYLAHEHPRAAYAAMVTRLDRSVGRIMELVGQLGIDQRTLALFSSDNGPTYLGGYDREFFKGAGPWRSHKGYVYEGGIRVPLIARWPGTIRAGVVSDHVCAFQDFLPTLMELVGGRTRVPAGIDGISFAPALIGRGRQKEHECLYMEFPAYGGQQMVRCGNWKAVRQNLLKNPDAPIELYDLGRDVSEQSDVALKHPEILAKIKSFMKAGHRPSREFPFAALDQTRQP